MKPAELPILTFNSGAELRAWLMANHAGSEGIWLRIAKSASRHKSVTFQEVLDEGLCFGWSESKRLAGDADFYLQRFTPRRRAGTNSKRNIQRAADLIAQSRMLPSGLKALGLHEGAGH
jgi:uncharacterized protein YdeI (YjbR/CyaY-like superfamily)